MTEVLAENEHTRCRHRVRGLDWRVYPRVAPSRNPLRGSAGAVTFYAPFYEEALDTRNPLRGSAGAVTGEGRQVAAVSALATPFEVRLAL